jgi:hypothetical protein
MEVEFTFINFCEEVKDQLPESQLNKGKFVQIRHENEGEYVIFSPLALCAYHAQIVERFCHLQKPNWSFEMNNKGDDGDLLEVGVSFIGGGFFEIFEDRKRLNLSGVSQAYGRYEGYGLDLKLKSTEQFSDYSIFC